MCVCVCPAVRCALLCVCTAADCEWLFADLLFMETSALTGECVDEVFLKCAHSILGKIESGTVEVLVC